MEMTGEHRIEAPRERVWQALNDPAILKQCIPGCEAIEQSSPTEFTAKVVAKVGPVKATFTGAVTLSELDPPKGYKITGEGKGGAAGFARGGAEVHLEEVEGATLLRYRAQGNVGGKLAQIGARLIDSTAKKLSDEFFANFAKLMGGAEAPAANQAAATEAASTKEAAPAVAPQPAVEGAGPMGAGLSPAVWIGAVVLLVVVLLLIFA